MTSKPLVRRTFATLRSAEFGFFGVVVYTRVQTPRRCGLFCSAGLLLLITAVSRPCRTSWLTVGILGFLKPGDVLRRSGRWAIRAPPRARGDRTAIVQGPAKGTSFRGKAS